MLPPRVASMLRAIFAPVDPATSSLKLALALAAVLEIAAPPSPSPWLTTSDAA